MFFPHNHNYVEHKKRGYMMRRKILIPILLLLFFCSSNVYAATTTGECGDSAAYILTDNVLVINGTGIVDNEDGWIDYSDVIDTLIVSEGIEELDSRMFDGFEILSSVSLPNSLTTIGTRTFRDCISLENLIIPDSVEDIASNSFSGCDNLTIICLAGSYAEEYAIKNSIKYKTISNITISFDGNGGENVPTSITGSMTDTFTIPQQKPTRKGYIFVGWSESSTVNEAKYHSGESVTFTDNITLYAVWLQCYFTDLSTENKVIVNSNATIPRLNLYVAAYGEENRLLDVILKLVTLKQGDNIIETGTDWSNLERTQVKAFLWDENLMPYTSCKDLLLTKNHEIVFEDWDGTIISTQSVVTGDDATLPNSPTRTGYSFVGWSGNYTSVTSDAKIVAQYIDSSKNNVFKVYSAKATKDENVKLTVCLGGIVETCGFDMRLKYDKEALEFINADGALDLDVIVKHDGTTGTINFNYSSAKNRTKGARIFEVEFKVKETIENSTTLRLSPVEIIKADATNDNIPVDADYTIENGVITIY